MTKNKLSYSIALILLGYAAPGMSQNSVDLQGVKPPQPAVESSILPRFQQSPKAEIQPGGAKVLVKSVEIEGNKSISKDQLQIQLKFVIDTEMDMAGLSKLATSITNFYRNLGYPFAQAYLPPQDLNQGKVLIKVIEGSYGSIKAVGTDEFANGAQFFLDDGLKSTDSIYSPQLERTLLILDDQPGFKVHPVIKPGANQGEADLVVGVERVSHLSGEIGVDNTGARSTGGNRVHGALFFDSPFRYGDKASLNIMHTDADMWLGSLDYEAPIGVSGLRGQIGYARTSYVLGGQFASLDAHGFANVTTTKLTYPLIRSQATNVTLSSGVLHKELQDDYRSYNSIRNKISDSIPIGLQFDHRDNLLTGGITYGSLSLQQGTLHLDAAASNTDAITARTQGSFSKFTLDIARIQKIYDDVSLYARYSAQWANKNLDASEKFNLGGYYGIRAYPLGEGVGDKGWLAQIEMRYAFDAVTPFAFFDYGSSRANINPWDANSGAVRTIAGGGFGARSIFEKWTIDGTLGWKTQGGSPTSDSVDKSPRFFLLIGKRF